MSILRKGCKGCGGDISRGTATGVCRACFDRRGLPPSEGMTVKGDNADLTKLVSKRVHTLAQLIAVCDIDTKEWEIVEHSCNVWEGYAKFGKPGEERIVQPQMWQIKARMKRRVSIVAARAEIADLMAEAKASIGRPLAPFVRPKTTGGHMLELSIPDLHIGKLAWAKETGHASYDTKIAVQLFREALEALVARTASYTFDQVVLVVGNDLLNADNKANTTTGGTPQDTDSRYQRSFLYARRMMTEAIERLQQIAPVEVFVVPGNHDTLAAWHLGDSLECRFHQTPSVTIHNEPTMRKYHRYGATMLMFTHGNKGKLTDYPLLMATEQKAMFGQTRFHEAHTGDKHHLKVQELHGVRVRISPALCAPDAWHAENMFVGAHRGAEAFVWSATEGLVGMAMYTVKES